MKNERRINLCFNIDDPRQKAAYEYLSAAGREKSATVVNIILQYISSDKRWRNDLMEREVRFTERFASIVKQIDQQRSAQLKTELKQIFSELDLSNPKSKPEPVQPVASSDDEMSDDAFDAVMAFMG